MARSGRPSPAVIEAWSALLEAHGRLVPRLDADLRAEHDLSLEWYDALHQLNEAGGSLTMGQLGSGSWSARRAVLGGLIGWPNRVWFSATAMRVTPGSSMPRSPIEADR